jgi:Zn-dependent peptidase ImmA (M78 family)
MSRVAIKKEVLHWAIDRSGRTLADLQSRFPKIEEWSEGETMPTLRQLELLAKTTSTPLGYLFLDKPPKERMPIPHFRTGEGESRSRPSPDLLETIQIMQRRQAWMRDYMIDQGQDQISFIRSARVNQRPQSVAQRIRDTLGFDESWAAQCRTWTEALRTLRETMEHKTGIMVVVNSVVGNNTHRKLNVDEFRGFVLVDSYAPLVFVNGADGKAAQMFTLAHELAHLVFGSSAAFDLRNLQPADNTTEQACNRVAAEFLVSEHELRRVWPSVRRDEEPFQKIARQFKVSALVAARRALDLELINRVTFLEFYDDYLVDERRTATRRADGGDFYLTQNLRVGRRFANAVIRATREGKLLYSDAYSLTSLYGKTFESYASSLEAKGY